MNLSSKIIAVAFFFSASLLGLLFLLISLFKWLFFPLGLVFALFFGLPHHRFRTTFTAKPRARLISDSALPDEVWFDLEEEKQVLRKQGFSSGQTIVTTNLIKHITLYVHSMVNHENNIGVGINCIFRQIPGGNDEPFNTHLEFSGLCAEGFVVDLSNSEQLDPFPAPPSRKRLLKSEVESELLYSLFLRLVGKTNCNTGDTYIKALTEDLVGLVEKEHTEFFQGFVKMGYLVRQGNRYHMTWKGAWIATWRSLWPTKGWLQKQSESEVDEIFQANGIDIEQIIEDYYDAEHDAAQQKAMVEPVKTIPQALAQIRRYHPGLITPGSIEVTLTDEQIWLIVLQQKAVKPIANRPYCWITDRHFSLDNDNLALSMDDQDEELYHEDNVDDYEDTRPIQPDQLQAVMQPLEVVTRIMKQTYEPVEVDFLVLRYEDDVLVWNATVEQDDEINSVVLDALNGDILEDPSYFTS